MRRLRQHNLDTVTRVDHFARRLALAFDRLPRWTADELARVVFEHEQSARAQRR